MNVQALLSIVVGGFFLVSLAAILGLLTKAKKLFEILFFLLTYANLNKVPLLDYFGGINGSTSFLTSISIVSLALSALIFGLRKLQLTKE